MYDTPHPGGWAKSEFDCTQSGLSLTVKGLAKVQVITLPINFAKSLIIRRSYNLFTTCINK